MCGIAGIVDLKGCQSVGSDILAMSNKLRHRGPDDEGFLLYNGVDVELFKGEDTCEELSDLKSIQEHQGAAKIALAHRRLSILDLSENGHQPMCIDGYYLVYNGELYNYLEIRKELESAGVSFVSNSDSEVLLRAYILWGEKCLDKFEGMWAFSIWDSVNNLLFCSRDRFGVKPFYYYFNENHFSFASELKSLVKYSKYNKEINEQAVFDYLVLEKTELDKETFFKDILELQPSTYIKLDLTSMKLKESCYYQLPDTKNEDNTSRALQEKLKYSVSQRLRSDVPVGICLSGGIDSSLLATYLPENSKAFTVSSIDEKINESALAKTTADKLSLQWQEITGGEAEFESSFEDLVTTQDIPFFSPSTYAQYFLMKGIKKEGIKVTIDGQGADEVFGGYALHYYTKALSHLLKFEFRAFSKMKSWPQSTFSNRSGLKSFIVKTLLTKCFPSLTAMYYRRNFELYKLLKPQFWNNNKHRFGVLSKLVSLNLKELVLNQLQAVDLKVLLRTGDRNSMRHSVESRLPFADSRGLMEWGVGLPDDERIANGKNKVLLRELLQKEGFDSVLKKKDKLAFQAVNSMWLKEDFIQSYLVDELNDYIDVKQVSKSLPDLMNNEVEHLKLWRIVNLGAWFKVIRTW